MKNKKTMSFVMMVVMMLQLFVAVNVFAATPPAMDYYNFYQVKYVGSTLGGFWEQMLTLNQTTTNRDHGGVELYVVTEQYGYDAFTVAKMNGVACSLAMSEKLYITYPTIAGYRRYWNCSGQQAGQFVATATSVNTYKQFTAWIYVR